MERSETVRAVLGEDASRSFERSVSSIREILLRQPTKTQREVLLPIPLHSDNARDARLELAHRLGSGRDWSYVIGTTKDGRRTAIASHTLRGTRGSESQATQRLLLSDLSSRLRSWRLTHAWRVGDLTENLVYCFEKGFFVPAAASARSLLEGVAAFSVEGETMLADWLAFRRNGAPTIEGAREYRVLFEGRLNQAEFGSRVSLLDTGSGPVIPRTNIMTLLSKFARMFGDEIHTTYAWLCDAVHPSYGSQSTYVASTVVHQSKALFLTDFARRVQHSMSGGDAFEPTVARESAKALDIACGAFRASMNKMTWFEMDLLLTAGLSSSHNVIATQLCPCGSQKPSRLCFHSWGGGASPP